jgi:hypothetical protein
LRDKAFLILKLSQTPSSLSLEGRGRGEGGKDSPPFDAFAFSDRQRAALMKA